MAIARPGDNVAIHYHGTLDNNEVFDSSREGEPFYFVLGAGNVIPGFDEAVNGMEVGASKDVVIEPEDAYGERIEDLVVSVPKEHLPPEAVEGMTFQVPLPDGQPYAFQVVAFEGENAVMDGNHPLAGKRLRFNLELVSVNADQ